MSKWENIDAFFVAVSGRIVGVRSTEQPAGIKVGAFDPDII